MLDIKSYQDEVEQAMDMIKLRIKNDSQSKFVQNYLNTIKEGEAVINKAAIDLVDSNFEHMVVSLKI